MHNYIFEIFEISAVTKESLLRYYSPFYTKQLLLTKIFRIWRNNGDISSIEPPCIHSVFEVI